MFNDPPTPQPYGIDTSFRDPSGNNIRLTQVMEFDMAPAVTRCGGGPAPRYHEGPRRPGEAHTTREVACTSG